MPTFTPPGVLEHTGAPHPLFSRMTITRGVTLLKSGVTYTQSRHPSDEDMAAADVVYLGGYTYVISAGEAAALTAAGYGDWVTPDD